jgi:hypothetical protein
MMCRMAAGSCARGCLVPSAPLEGAGSDAAEATFVRSTNPVAYAVVMWEGCEAPVKTRKDKG